MIDRDRVVDDRVIRRLDTTWCGSGLGAAGRSAVVAVRVILVVDGRLPAPAPATVFDLDGDVAVPIVVTTAGGAVLDIDARMAMTGPPASVRIGREPPVAVPGWAGPWPMEERWWDPAETSRLVRFQLCLADGTAVLVTRNARNAGQWRVEGIYD